jgi:hypothetical protein
MANDVIRDVAHTLEGLLCFQNGVRLRGKGVHIFHIRSNVRPTPHRFHETQKCLGASCADLLYRISSNS